MLELILDLLDRVARGFLFALPVAALWFSALGFQKHGRTTQHIGLSLVFLLYLSGVLSVTGIRRPFGFFPAAVFGSVCGHDQGAGGYDAECAAVFAAGRVSADFARGI